MTGYDGANDRKVEPMLADAELLSDCPPDVAAMRPTYKDLKMALARIKELEQELEHLRAPVRPSLEVLQRMANGIDPFDRGRFQCAVAALPHETPKLSATINHHHNTMDIGARLDAARGLRVIEGGPQAG